MNESARNKLSDAPVEVNNEEALKARLEDAWRTVELQVKTVIRLEAQIKILKEIISEGLRSY
jgi:hypothetical protein